MKRILNASQLPRVFFGLHMSEGVAQYHPEGEKPLMIFLNNETIKHMDQTFQGRPVYVHHVEEVDVADIGKADAKGKLREAGYVIRSFYNKADGKHWAEFLVVSDEGQEAIRKGWKLSNAYHPKDMVGSGMWHGVPYQKEVKKGEYEHLAIVPNPRYAESIILTPEEFKAYNSNLETALLKIANSKEEKKVKKLSFWKKQAVQNEADLEGVCVTLKNGTELSIEKLVETVYTNGYTCNGDEMVNMGDSQLSVNDLLAKHMKLNEEHDALKKKYPEDDKKENKEEKVEEKVAEKKENEEGGEESDDKKENKDEKVDEKADDKKENKDEKEVKADDKKENHFETMKNAHVTAMKPKAEVIETSQDRVARGKARYGS